MSNTWTYCTSTWEITDLEQLQYDLCECSTKSQAPTFSVNSSSQVPLVAAENFRLERGRKHFTILCTNFLLFHTAETGPASYFSFHFWKHKWKQVHSLFSRRFSVQWWMGKAVCWGCIHCPAWSNNILADKPTANSSRHSVLGQGATDPGLLPMCQFHWWWIKQKTMGQNCKMTLTLITSNHYFQTGLSVYSLYGLCMKNKVLCETVWQQCSVYMTDAQSAGAGSTTKRQECQRKKKRKTAITLHSEFIQKINQAWHLSLCDHLKPVE